MQVFGDLSDNAGRLLAIAIPLVCFTMLAVGLVKLRGVYIFVSYALVLAGCALVTTRNDVPTLSPRTPGRADLPNVLLVTIDTLRADHVGAYGYQRARTPNLDTLAEYGQVFTQAIAPAYLTGPSHASILTGRLPEQHGVLRNAERLEEHTETLAELLRPKGYVSAAFPSGFTTEDSASGLPSRFDWYDDDLRSHLRWMPQSATRLVVLKYVHRMLRVATGDDIIFPMYRPAAPTARLVYEWLEKNGDPPFFMWLHFYDPHLPYQAPPRYVDESVRNHTGPVTGRWYDLSEAEVAAITSSPDHVQQMLDLYDAEIAYADEQLGEITSALRAQSGDRELITIVTADHGRAWIVLGARPLRPYSSRPARHRVFQRFVRSAWNHPRPSTAHRYRTHSAGSRRCFHSYFDTRPFPDEPNPWAGNGGASC